MARDPQSDTAQQPVEMNRQAAEASDAPAKRLSKTSLVLELLARTEGATLNQMATATGWLPHTTRAALTGLKKKGHVISSKKVEGTGRVYRIATA
jgi:predicted ArsR family transcriptional regulator